MNKQRNYQKGITLIALVITIIVLLILAGVTLSIVFNGGIINKSQNAVDKYSEESAREKLTLSLIHMKMEKVTNEEYNSEGYLTSKLSEDDVDVVSNELVIVDGHQFIIDREELIIKQYVGKGNLNNNINIEIATPTINSDFTNPTVKTTFSFDGEINKILINGQEKELGDFTLTNGVYNLSDVITENMIYRVYIQDKTGNYNTKNLKISELVSDLKISDLAGFEAFRDKVNAGAKFAGKVITLMNDIDLECSEDGKQWMPIGNYGTDSNHYFSGTFDGNNHKINNLYITTSTTKALGLFGCVSNGEVKNVILENGKIIASANTGRIGGISGFVNNGSTIYNCINKNVEIVGNYQYAGGITGDVRGDTTNYCTVQKCINNATVYGAHTAGGITGIMVEKAKVLECYNTGTVSATLNNSSDSSVYSAGGIVGGFTCYNSVEGKIENCYNTGSIKGNKQTGGIAGYLYGSGKHIINKCYSTGILTGENIYGIAGISITSGGTPQRFVTNNYWIAGCGANYGTYSNSNTGASSFDDTEEDIANVLIGLGDAYTINKSVSNYPILK